jgi:hypothetical protein
MATEKMITYECTECGSEVVVTSTGDIEISPIYCCGIEVIEVPSIIKKQTKTKKPVGKQVTKKIAPKKVTSKKATSKKRPAAKKK